MKIKDFFHQVRKINITDIKNNGKNILESDRIEFEDYFITVYLYETSDEYYCYLSVSTLDDCRSNLLNKSFSDIEESKKYYIVLYNLAIGGNLEEIKNKVNKNIK